MSIAVAAYLSAISDAKVKECRANMQTIANLEEKYRISNATHATTTTLSALSTGGATVPLCPDGYSYTISFSNGTQTAQNGQTVPSGNVIITCGEAAHGKYAPGVDTY
jgi:Tfp pilus assembly protein PilE